MKNGKKVNGKKVIGGFGFWAMCFGVLGRKPWRPWQGVERNQKENENENEEKKRTSKRIRMRMRNDGGMSSNP
ncbi:MAG: hypothetical protein JXR41_03430 [Bacteroidales bacterium]|nr:hypothetical protein [Bacteroidales bacterium]MBN2762118.1 hypothetical protein [Bacteroidales bacterium]